MWLRLHCDAAVRRHWCSRSAPRTTFRRGLRVRDGAREAEDETMTSGNGQVALIDEHARARTRAPRVSEAIAAAVRWTLANQHAHGYWHAPLEANVTMEAQYVFFNRLMRRQRPDLDQKMAERLLALQQADGS